MGQVHWSEPALDDLRDIVSFIARIRPPMLQSSRTGSAKHHAAWRHSPD